MVTDQIEGDDLDFSLSFAQICKLNTGDVVYRGDRKGFMIVAGNGFLSYVSGRLVYRYEKDFTPHTKSYVKFALVDADIIVRNKERSGHEDILGEP
jgi:hypothetical protein